ncbi:MAG: phage portal protein, partial [Methanosarcinales archaeon]|nr:phage portal protein [Methanosarcinales archaeon]
MAEIPLSKKDYTDPELIKWYITNWLSSDILKEMKTGLKYYRGEHDILKRGKVGFDRNVFDTERNVGEFTSSCGATGTSAGGDNLPDNRLIDNRYSVLVDQKSNYLLGN